LAGAGLAPLSRAQKEKARDHRAFVSDTNMRYIMPRYFGNQIDKPGQ
jgi:hypothetical protein